MRCDRWQALYLDGNKIGDAGCAALAEVVASGALPKCTEIVLFGNPASVEAKQAVKDALERR